jgi:PadR family transcriptional regulator PadR
MGRPKHSSPNIDRILGALVDGRDDWHYGYELSRRLDIAPGSLYPALIRLSDDGLLDAQWDLPADGGRPRHLYRITAAGRAFVAGRTVTGDARTRASALLPHLSGGLA